MDPISVLLVDDHEVVRDGLRWMLHDHQRIEVVGEATNGQQALERVAALLPSVVLMDVKMPIMDGLEATRRLKTEYPTIYVIIMTSYADHGLVVEAVRAGASGYLLKHASKDLVIHTIGAAASGAILVDATLLRQVVGGPGSEVRALSEGDVDVMEPLSGRERRVLQLLSEGKTNREIGQTLGYAEVTVKKYIQVILAKLHVVDRTQAATTAMRLGLID